MTDDEQIQRMLRAARGNPPCSYPEHDETKTDWARVLGRAFWWALIAGCIAAALWMVAGLAALIADAVA